MVDADFPSFFAGKRVLITGHTGFKGSWLAFILSEWGAEVLGYALPPASPEGHFALLRLFERLRHVEADVRDGRRLAEEMLAFRPDLVFHLAAQPLVRLSYADPKTTFETNVMGSVNLLEGVQHCESVRSLVYITSDKCYENHGWIWGYREIDRLGGYDPYSASKAAAEIVFSAYARSFFAQRSGLGAASVRAGNVIGGGDWALDRIVPDCVRAIRAGQPVRLRNPTATRPWQHVLEPLCGYLMLAIRLWSEPQRYAGAWNFGPDAGQYLSVKELAERIVTRFGCGTVEVEHADSSQHEARLLQLNSEKAQQLLGWRPRWGVERSILETADWYKKVIGGAEPRAVSGQQIRSYFTEWK